MVWCPLQIAAAYPNSLQGNHIRYILIFMETSPDKHMDMDEKRQEYDG